LNIEGSIVAYWHIEQGTHAIVSVGTTGESPTLNVDEHMQVIQVTIEQAAGRIPVIAGTGANSTLEAIEQTKAAKKLGADASLQVVPYYNKPSQEGMYQHFSSIANAVDIPIILYNVPSRTIVDLSNQTVLKLTAIPNIVGIKDATGDLERGRELINMVPDDFAVYSGDDSTALELMKRGAKGDISVTANVLPKLMSELYMLALSGKFDQAKAIDDRLAEIHQGLFIEPSPCATKWALQQLGLIEDFVRLPIIPLSESSRPRIRQLLNDLSLL